MTRSRSPGITVQLRQNTHFVWMVRDSLCGLRLQQGNTVLVATLAYEVKR
ncbi:Hok/Gef family protein [Salmonella enterica]|nr:Hok/Gef family protein [Salmonella enterica]